MPTLVLQTHHLDLHLQSTEAVLARISLLSPEHQTEVSPEWVDRVRASSEPSPWTHGFAIVERMSGAMIGSCAFKGPPDAEGVAEIAYEIAPAHQRRGYAREAARAASHYALEDGGARCVRAHTRQEHDSSARVLLACGFSLIGPVDIPDDGLVYRWELPSPQH
jgi:[ribosomal protein S5]-alanine N-acetyltransferase